MKRIWTSLAIALSATIFMLYQSGAFASPPVVVPQVSAQAQQTAAVTLEADRTSLDNGGTITVTGTAPAGRPVYLEIWSEEVVRASRFDSAVDEATGQRPYILYMTHEMPAYYKMFIPKERQGTLEKVKEEGSEWSFSQALKDVGADTAYSAPAGIAIDRYQSTLAGSVIGSRGELLPSMDAQENRKRSMQLVKARFREPEKVLGADIEISADGAFKADIEIRGGLAPHKYIMVASVDKDTKSQPVTFENNISFPNLYLGNAGTSLNLFGPFLLTLAISIFGVLMGAGGGFIMNPLLVSIWPLPHTVVAGTVMPTVLFSQASGIYNYSRLKFISWRLGITIGLAMLVGGFIGPKLTELITLDQFKFVFGLILIVLAALMFWQTTPGYLRKNKKEQAILKEFKRRAQENAKAKQQSLHGGEES